ncbi:MAG: SEC-C metal-binding domain-containing protein [Dehalococcoidales bacterium]|nr:SEC-C metal-binding domain-containing protein [Dehalococcoidales bacterium]
MKTERNAPCPCGSGKKYKKCCGQSQNKPDYFAINRAAAYEGAIGKQRETFCIDYTALKKAKIVEIESSLQQQIGAAGKTISCSRGCGFCCQQYVVASLKECEAIVYYLYQHDKAREHFIKAFDNWRDRIVKIERCFQNINNLGEKFSLGQDNDEDRQLFIEESFEYASRRIPCPFLIEDSCSIYEVRPYACAGFVSASPPEWCQVRHQNNSESLHFKAATPADNEVPYYIQPESDIISSLPFMVHRILEEGYDALAAMTGAVNLTQADLL